jgi:hypothetical protein
MISGGMVHAVRAVAVWPGRRLQHHQVTTPPIHTLRLCGARDMRSCVVIAMLMRVRKAQRQRW